MNEKDAIGFIEPVLLGFLSRNFNDGEGEKPEFYGPYLETIKNFIQDNESYWIREKALYVVSGIEQAETEIHAGRYTPTSPENFVKAVLERTKDMLEDIIRHHRDERQKDRMAVLYPLPFIPKMSDILPDK